MKRLYCICIVASLLWQYEGKAWTTTKPTPTNRYPVTSDGQGVNLKGKMVTLSQDSSITFYSPATGPATPKTTTTTPKPTTTTPKTTTTTPKTTTTTPKPTTTTPRTTTTTPKTTTTTPRTTTTTPKTTTTTPRTTTARPTPGTRGVTVCLRFMTDSDSLNLFQLAPLKFSWRSSSWYILTTNYYTSVALNARISLWSSVQPQLWTSVCVVLDSFKNVVQVFEGGSMSIRKILSSQFVWSGQPVLDVSGFDGQVTDLEVWDYPLGYAQVFSYMQNYGSRGTVLTWSNIAYRYRGNILLEDTYARQQKQPINSNEGQEQPIQIERGWSHRFKYRKMFDARQKRRQMF